MQTSYLCTVDLEKFSNSITKELLLNLIKVNGFAPLVANMKQNTAFFIRRRFLQGDN